MAESTQSTVTFRCMGIQYEGDFSTGRFGSVAVILTQSSRLSQLGQERPFGTVVLDVVARNDLLELDPVTVFMLEVQLVVLVIHVKPRSVAGRPRLRQDFFWEVKRHSCLFDEYAKACLIAMSYRDVLGSPRTNCYALPVRILVGAEQRVMRFVVNIKPVLCRTTSQ